jgi:MerR family mercuric resistance operon transcriptional regulator
MPALTIGHLGKESGVNLETVRYYERRGLLPKPPRSASGYRLFPADTARRLRFIQRAKELGFSLREIRELLSLRASPSKTSAEIRTRAETKIADIEAKIRTLESMKKTLRKLTKSCAGCEPIAHCPILESLGKEDA